MPDETTQPVATGTEGTVTVEVPASEVAAVESLVHQAEAEMGAEVVVPEVPTVAEVGEPEPEPEPDLEPVVEPVEPTPTAPPVVGLRFTAAVDTPDRRFEPGDESTFDELVADGVDAPTLAHLGILVPVYASDSASSPAPEGTA